MQDTTTYCKMLDTMSVIWWITRVESINNALVSQNGKLLRNEETIIEMQRGKSVLFLIMLRKTVTEQTWLCVVSSIVKHFPKEMYVCMIRAENKS